MEVNITLGFELGLPTSGMMIHDEPEYPELRTRTVLYTFLRQQE